MSEEERVIAIGDIAGNYKTFLALLEKLPKGRIISVGDIIDRGPSSKEVVQWFIDHPEHTCLRGNHEDFAIQIARNNNVYDSTLWHSQGGQQTLASFGGQIPDDVLSFLCTRKYFVKVKLKDKWYLISHAFPSTPDDIDLSSEEKKRAFIWNRRAPVPSEKFELQIAGHNSHMGLYWFSENDKRYGVCIDTSKSNILTAISLPSGIIYQQEYID